MRARWERGEAAQLFGQIDYGKVLIQGDQFKGRASSRFLPSVLTVPRLSFFAPCTTLSLARSPARTDYWSSMWKPWCWSAAGSAVAGGLVDGMGTADRKGTGNWCRSRSGMGSPNPIAVTLPVRPALNVRLPASQCPNARRDRGQGGDDRAPVL